MTWRGRQFLTFRCWLFGHRWSEWHETPMDGRPRPTEDRVCVRHGCHRFEYREMLEPSEERDVPRIPPMPSRRAMVHAADQLPVVAEHPSRAGWSRDALREVAAWLRALAEERA